MYGRPKMHFFIFGRKRKWRRKWNCIFSRKTKTKTKVTCAYHRS